MIEKYKEINNNAHNACDIPNALNITAKMPTPKGQQLELWSPIEEITNQIEVKSEEN